jgi:CHASE3 domain sensor protein
MLSSMTVRNRLFSLIAFFSLVILILSIISYTQLNEVNEDYKVVTDNVVPSVNALARMRNSLNRIGIYERIHIMNTDPDLMDDYEVLIAEQRAIVEEMMVIYEPLATEQEQPIFAALRNDWKAYLWCTNKRSPFRGKISLNKRVI